ncbi:hypothetical protein FQV39_11295 [Bosea sp. F3-2]|uniref:hypothetical protein n=1 Tax=Bosea sp. F3-2 TaxID=2599640 RepID=UPI0011EEBDB0|nr:hypothetical protein [Bosea sp. F3-2]QEL23088.1 hypothetical protein FQV39_11295 [Bosea sp. F3-2]
MGDPRSLTPLSQADYEAIEAAVMETSRGRWFMAEYAKRNRQADTLQLLGAIHRIERVVGLGVQETSRETNLIEAAALISDLRSDLERVSGKADIRSSGLAVRIEQAAGTVLSATENIQEAAWGLREAGADEGLCDKLDQHSAEISTAIAVVDGLVQRIDKISDTIAMLDSSLRAFGEISREPSTSFEIMAAAAERTVTPTPPPPAIRRSYGDASIAASDEPSTPYQLNDQAAPETRMGTVHLLDDDLAFEEPPVAPPEPQRVAAGYSEAGLREIDALQADRKLAYFV